MPVAHTFSSTTSRLYPQQTEPTIEPNVRFQSCGPHSATNPWTHTVFTFTLRIHDAMAWQSPATLQTNPYATKSAIGAIFFFVPDTSCRDWLASLLLPSNSLATRTEDGSFLPNSDQTFCTLHRHPEISLVTNLQDHNMSRAKLRSITTLCTFPPVQQRRTALTCGRTDS